MFDGLLGNYRWRSYLPTMALAVGSSREERLALGDWQSKELLKQSAAITPRYAEVKSGMARMIKAKLSRVQLIRGFPAVGRCAWSAVFPSRQQGGIPC